MSNEKLILLGTHDDYIHSARFDPISKTIRKDKTTKTEPHPSWLARHPRNRELVYSVSWSAGKIFALRLNGREGDFEVLDSVTTGGVGLNFIEVMPDCASIQGACYGSGSVVTVQLDKDGLFKRDNGEGLVSTHTIPHTLTPRPHDRQNAPHAHQIFVQGDKVLVPDLGSNVVWRRSWKDGNETASPVEYDEGTGPRHVALHPNGTHLYTICELSSELVVHSFSQSSSEIVSRHSILPPADAENGPKMLASEILLLPSTVPGSKHLLLCTNRDSPNPEGDAIALFAVDQDGSVERTRQGWITGVGRHLRGMLADKEGKFVAVAGRDGGGLTIFERDGLRLTKVAQLDVDNVVVPLWID